MDKKGLNFIYLNWRLRNWLKMIRNVIVQRVLKICTGEENFFALDHWLRRPTFRICQTVITLSSLVVALSKLNGENECGENFGDDSASHIGYYWLMIRQFVFLLGPGPNPGSHPLCLNHVSVHRHLDKARCAVCEKTFKLCQWGWRRKNPTCIVKNSKWQKSLGFLRFFNSSSAVAVMEAAA